MVSKLLAQSNVEVKDELSRLLLGESIVTNLDEEIVFSQLYKKRGAIWSLLMASGYVKPLAFDLVSQDYEIIFTNQEVQLIMDRLIFDWFHNATVDANEFREALLADNLDVMNESLTYITENIFSFFDTGGKKPERFYHAFVLGLIVDLKGRYEITSNRESAYGRYDVMMIPKHSCDHAIVIEFKTIDKEKEGNLKITCKNALAQIKEKKYINSLLIRDIDEKNIYVYGMAFQGKKVQICGGSFVTIDWDSILK